MQLTLYYLQRADFRFKLNRNRNQGNEVADPPSSPPPAPWWTEECSKPMRDRKEAARKYRSNPTNDNYNDYAAAALLEVNVSWGEQKGWVGFNFVRKLTLSPRLLKYGRCSKGIKTVSWLHLSTLHLSIVTPLKRIHKFERSLVRSADHSVFLLLTLNPLSRLLRKLHGWPPHLAG